MVLEMILGVLFFAALCLLGFEPKHKENATKIEKRIVDFCDNWWFRGAAIFLCVSFGTCTICVLKPEGLLKKILIAFFFLILILVIISFFGKTQSIAIIALGLTVISISVGIFSKEKAVENHEDDYSTISPTATPTVTPTAVPEVLHWRVKVYARKQGEKEWKSALMVHEGDLVEIQIEFINYSSVTVENVILRDNLPVNLQYCEGSSVFYNANYQEGLQIKDGVTTGGVNIGSYLPEGNGYIRFLTRVVVVEESRKYEVLELVNWGKATINGVDESDSNSITVLLPRITEE